MTKQRTRKHIPTNRWDWEREVRGINMFIERARHSQNTNGSKWVDSMLRYYRNRLDDLYDNEPDIQSSGTDGK